MNQSTPIEPSLMLVNRLNKNLKRLSKWLKKSQIKAYRVYDADIPEFAAAIDIYELAHGPINVVIQEYAPPKSIEPEKAQQRLSEIVASVQAVFKLDASEVFVKTRQRQKGKQQYERNAEKEGNERLITEGSAMLRVNLSDYLDTGIFLDHRPMRRYMFERAAGKSVLNLFCYTASVSVQAALGGAIESLSIDMSNTYLDWARRNFLSNKLDKSLHKLKREDCLTWLEEASGKRSKKYDLIFLDPPSFSNSKKMDSVLDVQRDHVMLIKQCMSLLRRSGELIFSNNLRSFNLDKDALAAYQIEDYHRQSLDLDFERNPRIHQCFLIRHV